MSKIKLYLANKLPSSKQTHEVEEYAKKHNLEIVEINSAGPIDDEFYNINSRKSFKPTSNAIIYARFSSANQQEISITGQLDVCFEYARKESYPVFAIYADMAQSGRTDNRIAFNVMNSHISKEKYNGFHLLIYQSNRLFRNKKKSIAYKCIFENYGIKLESVTSPSYEGASGALLETVQEGVDQYFSDILSESVVRGMKQRALQCRYTGGYVTYGYKINEENKYEILESEAENVRLIFNMYINKKGYTEILRVLNEKGVVSRTGRPFTKNALADMISNEKYKGVYTFNKRASQNQLGTRNSHKFKDDSEIIKIPGGVPAIIDEKTFELAQKRKEENKHGTKSRHEKENYLLTGLVYCKECGHAFTGNRRFSGRNKIKYVTYRCTNHNKGEKCDCKEVNRDYLETFVLNSIVKNVLAPEKFDELLTSFRASNDSAEKEYKSKITSLSREIASKEIEKENLLNALEKGTAADLILERLSKKDAEIKRLKFEVDDIKSHPPKEIDEKEFKKLINKTKKVIDSKNSDALRKLISYYVSRIEIGKDDVSVVLAFSNVVLLVGGGEGSRTPVRKSIHTAFYECSLSLGLPCRIPTNRWCGSVFSCSSRQPRSSV